MPFNARSFIFDNIPSESRNVYIGTPSGSGESTSTGSDTVSPLTQKLFRKAVPLFYGAELTPVFSMPLDLYFPGNIDEQEYSHIATWLFGQPLYRKLWICQNDMMEVYINCFLNDPQVFRTGNLISGVTCTIIADSPWGWKNPITTTYNFPDSYSINQTINFFNRSANSGYTYPSKLEITANIFGGSISITNITDNNRQFLYTPMLPLEVLTVNNYLQTISSTSVAYPLANFNLHFFRTLPNLNQLTISGNVSKIVIESEVAVKIA